LNAPRRSAAALAVLALVAVLLIGAFVALGTWQLERRAWKLELIDRVEARVHASPAPAPARAQWPAVTAANDEYRRVRIAGTYLHDHEALVQASTVLGGGYWVLTPLRTADGSVVLVNRGFVPPDRRERSTRSAGEPGGEVEVTGLLRITEPGGGFLRRNDAAANRWYSRDVQAIAAARGLTGVAPYFIDAGDPSAPVAENTWPASGLTVVAFNNNHLVYAITWYTLALMVAAASAYALRQASSEVRRRS
jgi:surfeit locus 1 family protein